ncbi:MAG: hypothetical protein ACOCYG_04095, partial [Spirochaetota bacterium]
YPSVDILQEDELTQYPTIDASDIATWEGLINDNLESQMDVAKDAANAALGALPDLSGLAGAFADAGVFASNVATLRSYTDYQSFYLAAGTNVGAQLPSGDLSSEEGVELLFEELAQGATLGAAWQTWAASLGLSLDFLIDGLYLSGKFGAIDATVPIDEETNASIESGSIGGFLNYLLVGNLWPNGPIRFRGISIGAGAVLHNSGIGIGIPVEQIAGDLSYEQGLHEDDIFVGSELEDFKGALQTADGNYPSDGNLGTASIGLDPVMDLSVSNSALTIPIEVATALRLLWLFDFSLGAGVDLSIGGDSSITLTGSGSADVDGYIADSDYLSTSGGQMTLTQESSGRPSFINPRITFGSAFNLGPFKLDFPFAVYFPMDPNKGPGLSGGMNVGLLW